MSALILPHGVAGLALFGAIMSAIWFPIAYLLSKRYESARPTVSSVSPSK